MAIPEERKFRKSKPEQRLERPDVRPERLTPPGLEGEFEIDPADFFDPEEFGYRRGTHERRA